MGFVSKGDIDGEHLELQIVPKTGNNYTLKAEGSGTSISLGNPTRIALVLGKDIGVGAASSDD